MRVPSIYRGGQSKMEIQMTSMIDVVFLLLVYFVWTAGFMIAEKILPSNVSAAAGSAAAPDEPPPPEADFENIVIRVQSGVGGVNWQVNGQPQEGLRQVIDFLTRIVRIKPDAPVILHPDPNVPLGDVIDAYDAARRAGIKKIQFAASAGPASTPATPNPE